MTTSDVIEPDSSEAPPPKRRRIHPDELPLRSSKTPKKKEPNIYIYLERLVQDAQELLEVMGATKSVLSGSRAADFFRKGYADDDSDWDFICGNVVAVALLGKYFKSIGVTWDDDGQPSGPDSVSVCRGRSKLGAKIQIIWMSHKRWSPMRHIIQFHSSCVQAYIGSSHAFSMYHVLTSRFQSLHWPHSRGDRYERSQAMMQKYSDRGVKYISYSDFRKGASLEMHLDPSAKPLLVQPDSVVESPWCQDTKAPEAADFSKINRIIRSRYECSFPCKEPVSWREEPMKLTAISNRTATNGGNDRKNYFAKQHWSSDLVNFMCRAGQQRGRSLSRGTSEQSFQQGFQEFCKREIDFLSGHYHEFWEAIEGDPFDWGYHTSPY